MRVAYLSRFKRDDTLVDKVLARLTPKPEYWDLLTALNADFVTHGTSGANVEPGYPALRLEAASAASANEVLDQDYDLVIASGEDVGIPLAVQALIRNSAVRIAILTHGFIARERGRLDLVRHMPTVSFLCLTNYVCRYLANDRAIPVDRLHEVGWPIDVDFFTPRAQISARQRPLLVSAGTASRDYSTLLRATTGLPLDIILAAHSNWFPEPLDVVPQDADATVRIGPAADYVELRSFYQQADVVAVSVYPTPQPCGTSVIGEAMAMGRPVVLTQSYGSNDFVVDGKTGILVRAGEPLEMRAAIRYILDNPKVASELGRAGRMRAVEFLSHHAFIERVMHALRL